MNKWLFTPFRYVAGSQALGIGILVMAATALIGYYSRTHFDGVLDVHNGRATSLLTCFVEQLADFSSIVLVFFISGKIFSSSSVRFIDIAGTMAMARWVLIFCAIIGFGIHVPETQPEKIEEMRKFLTPMNVALAFLSLGIIIWFVALTYHAFSVSLNMKGGKAVAVFVIALLVAEILSKVVLYYLTLQL